MSNSINKVILVGTVGKDPEIRRMQNGSAVAGFSVATGERWKDKQTGESKENTTWHRVAVFNDNLIRVIEDFIQKGTMVYIEGKLETRKWLDSEGKEKETTEVVLRNYGSELQILGRAKEKAGGPPVASPEAAAAYRNKVMPTVTSPFADEEDSFAWD